MNSIQKEMLEVLRDHRGRRNAISSTEIAERVGISESNGNPATRFEIRELMMESETPIGSCSEGYYIIETRDELEEYIRDLEGRISGIEDRIELVEECFEGSTPPRSSQTTLVEVAD